MEPYGNKCCVCGEQIDESQAAVATREEWRSPFYKTYHHTCYDEMIRNAPGDDDGAADVEAQAITDCELCSRPIYHGEMYMIRMVPATQSPAPVNTNFAYLPECYHQECYDNWLLAIACDDVSPGKDDEMEPVVLERVYQASDAPAGLMDDVTKATPKPPACTYCDEVVDQPIFICSYHEQRGWQFCHLVCYDALMEDTDKPMLCNADIGPASTDHWIFADTLRRIVGTLNVSDKIYVNAMGNLKVVRGDVYIGFIDLLEKRFIRLIEEGGEL